MKLSFLLVFYSFLSLSILAGDFKGFVEENRPLDINGDGKIDLVKSQISPSEFVLTFNPSWDLDYKKVTTATPFKNKVEHFRKNILYRSREEFKKGLNGKIDHSVILEGFKNGVPHTKIEFSWDWDNLNKEEKKFSFINNSWVFIESRAHKIELKVNNSLNGCYENIVSLEESVGRPLSGILGWFTKETKSSYIGTNIGLRINTDECSPKAIEQLDRAISEIYNQYLPCIGRNRPELAERFLSGIAANQNKVRCDIGSANQREKMTLAYTYADPSADIVMLYHSSNGFPHSDDDIAQILFHEILHHHFESCDDHNDGGVSDAIYGCSSICSGKNGEEIEDFSSFIFKGYSREGCVSCLTAPFLDGTQGEIQNGNAELQCSEILPIAEKERCQSKLKQSHCSHADYLRYKNPNFQKCLDVGFTAKQCLSLNTETFENDEYFNEFLSLIDSAPYKKCFELERHIALCSNVNRLRKIASPEFLSCSNSMPDYEYHCLQEDFQKAVTHPQFSDCLEKARTLPCKVRGLFGNTKRAKQCTREESITSVCNSPANIDLVLGSALEKCLERKGLQDCLP